MKELKCRICGRKIKVQCSVKTLNSVMMASISEKKDGEVITEEDMLENAFERMKRHVEKFHEENIINKVKKRRR